MTTPPATYARFADLATLSTIASVNLRSAPLIFFGDVAEAPRQTSTKSSRATKLHLVALLLF